MAMDLNNNGDAADTDNGAMIVILSLGSTMLAGPLHNNCSIFAQ
jgi:hypothetical protein